jgi:hypothetical protein
MDPKTKQVVYDAKPATDPLKAPKVVRPAKPRITESRASHEDALRQNLRLKVMYDEAKIDRMIEFERDELRRKGHPEEELESLMERAIGRWEQNN